MRGLQWRPGESGLGEEARAALLGGLFLEPAVPASFVAFLPSGGSASVSFPGLPWRGEAAGLRVLRGFKGCFLSVSLSIKGRDEFEKEGSVGLLGGDEEKRVKEVLVKEGKKSSKLGGAKAGAVNTTKHLWAGAVAAMVSRFVLLAGCLL